MTEAAATADCEALREEIQGLRQQIDHHQVVIATLVKRAGGRVYMSELELEAVVGYAVRMTYEDDGVLVTTGEPASEREVDVANFVHPMPHRLQ